MMCMHVIATYVHVSSLFPTCSLDRMESAY